MTTKEKINEKWDVQLRKGTLELAILAALDGQKLYGLELLNHMHSFDTMKITEGTLYPLMDRLKRDGVVEAAWVQEGDTRPRKYYSLTSQGAEKLQTLKSRWRQSVKDIESLFNSQPNKKQKNKGE